MNAILCRGIELQPGTDTSEPYPTFTRMRFVRRWLIADASKVPHYITGQRRAGTLDGPDDLAQLATYEDARATIARLGAGWLLGFSLGPDDAGGCWQGIDLDKVEANALADLANAAPGYVEVSPSGVGAHAIGYGRRFETLGSNGTGIEAYAAARYFTVTEHPIRDAGITCLAGFVQDALVPRHRGGSRAAIDVNVVAIPDGTKRDLRSALQAVPANDYHLWVRMGLALAELGLVGRALWLEWSALSDKFDPANAARKWATFRASETTHQAVFAEAARHGWLNPLEADRIRHGAEVAAVLLRQMSSALETAAVAPAFQLEFAMTTDTATLSLNYLLDPWLPMQCVVGFFGRGSTAKSSFLASMAAAVSGHASTLWISVEEPDDWIKVRHIRCGGADKTLAVVKAIESRRDNQGRVVASSFNLLADLEPAIQQAKDGFAREQRPPLRLVVLDTAVGLTHWGKGESPNDDAAVKKLLAHLQAWAERYDLAIAVIGHSNKGTHDHLADSVMGAAAWTNSPRLSFIHAADRREDYAYVVRVAKSNFDMFGAPYRTEPVHTLYQRQNGPDTVLVKVVTGEVVWGSLDSMDMFKEATRVSREDDGSGAGALPSAPKVSEVVLQALVSAVLEVAPGECVTREQVEQLYGKQVDRARWQKVEHHLLGHPTIRIERGDKNKALYRRTV